MIFINKTCLPLVLAAALLLLPGACSDDKDGKKQGHKGKHGKRAQLVEVYKAGLKRHHITTTRSGTISPRKIVKLFNQEEGRIVSLAVYENDRVKKDQLLIQLDDALLKAEYNKAAAKKLQAEQNLSRVRKLIKRNLIAQDQLTKAVTDFRVASADADLLKTRLGNARIVAPFDGVVTERFFEPGDVVSKHKHILTVIDPDSFIINLHVSENLLSTLKVNDPVKVLFDSLGHTRHEAYVKRIHPTVDSQTRQGIIEVALRQLPQGIKSGQSCRVFIASQTPLRLSIPFNALRTDHHGEYVFIVSEKISRKKDKKGKAGKTTIAKRIEVRSGARQGDTVEILEGIEEGTLVVSKGFTYLKSGKAISISNLSDVMPGDNKQDKKKRSIVKSTQDE